MHPCLQIEEMLELICEATRFASSAPRYSEYSAVYALQRTCQTLRVPATKILWNTLPGLVPLLLTLPDDLLEDVKDPNLDNFSITQRVLTFRRVASDSDWERFDYYAAFVRQMGNSLRKLKFSTKSITFDDEIVRQLEMRSKSKALLPNLNKIVLQPGKYIQPPSLLRNPSVLLSSSVHSLQLRLDSHHITDIVRVVDAIASLHLSLKCLRLATHSSSWTHDLQDAIFPAFLSLLKNANLEEFESDWLILSRDSKMMETLFQMPALQKLHILTDIPVLAHTLDVFPLSEPRLKKVVIRTSNISPSHLPQILSNMRASLLESLIFYQAYFPSTLFSRDDLLQLLFAITQHCSPQYLKDLRLPVDMSGFPPSRVRALGVCIDYILLHPLLTFSNLRCIILHDNPPDFGDAEVRDLAMSWPLLETLIFNAFIPPDFRPRTTLKCLLWFAIYCPNLEKLSFTFDATGPVENFDGDSEFLTAASESCNRLPHLSVGDSPIAEPDRVAAFVGSVFPKLSTLKYSEDYYSVVSMRDMWAQVSAKVAKR
ncbi:hypothetical protein BDN70DRAFT_994809 [Pholiota conissans]|uniref:F-box domain-containing protein n=1 Tax=Pholiota conissans TaxID=109636 RepID=A0A9P5YYZ9_9AGAR|nr:hypothetical protein BDN70DRAFT_994809 [Pholiota conissans]